MIDSVDRKTKIWCEHIALENMDLRMRGATLLEAVVVVAIISVILAAAAFSFRSPSASQQGTSIYHLVQRLMREAGCFWRVDG